MRFSVRTYLHQAKRHLQRPNRNDTVTRLVVGNESADLDSITCAIVYGYIQSSKAQERRNNEFVIPVTNIPAVDLALRPELTTLLRHAGVTPDDLITLDDIKQASLQPNRTTWTLVDHNALTGPLGQTFAKQISGVIDHHDEENVVPQDGSPRIVTKSGSCSSLVVNHCRDAWDAITSQSSSIGAAIAQDDGRLMDDSAYTSTWSAHVAKLALGALFIDTVNMTSEDKITDHDRKAVRYLEARINIAPKTGKDYDRDRFFEELNTAKSNIDALSLNDILRKDYKEWTESSLKLGMSSVVKPISFLKGKSDELSQDLLKFASQRNLQLFAVMTAFTNDSGDFARELIVLTRESEKATGAAKLFAQDAASELQLKDYQDQVSADGEVAWVHTWEQHNLAASRKRVGPLLRQAMKK